MEKKTTIKISLELKQRLASLCKKDQSYEEIIKLLIDKYKKNK